MRELSEQAKVAQAIRTAIKADGYVCKATSSSASMMTAVDVTLPDMHPDTVAAYTVQFEPHEYGTFDGMTDCQGSKNRDFKGPQVKYLSIGASHSAELQDPVWEAIRTEAHGTDDDGRAIPENYAEAYNYRIGNEFAGSILLRKLHAGSDSPDYLGDEFWEQYGQQPRAKPERTAAPRNTSGTAEIQKHYHEKRQRNIYLVVPPVRVDRSEYIRLRDEAKLLGGWYSRAWQGTPAGYAFATEEAAEQFRTEQYEGVEVAPSAPTPKPGQGAKFRALADTMQLKIEAAFSDRLENTPKRMAQGARARLEGRRLERTQCVLRALAELHDKGAVPEELAGIRNKANVYDCMGAKLTNVPNGFHSYHTDSNEPRDEDPTTLALWALLSPPDPEAVKAEQIAQKVRDLKFSNIPGYFPTPNVVIEVMLSLAEVEAHHRVLEPSLGHGAIADHVQPLCAEVEGFEINPSLAEICELKGYLLKQADFMQCDTGRPDTLYDRVLMNPPFENLQDCAHVMRALSWLNPGGRLVAVMSPAWQYRTDKKAEAFRRWAEAVGAEWHPLPEGSFRASGTSVSTGVLVVGCE